jgi:UDP-N-acetylglucosamine/UDP-N-acetylgalactosamine diphosphorylase
MFPLGMKLHHYLFGVQGERIKRLQHLAAHEVEGHKHDAVIPWYIMTSGATKNQTREFFQEQSYFGLNPKNIAFFEQNQIPCLTTSGQV